MQCDRADKHNQQSYKKPVEEEVNKWKLKNKEPDVFTELRIISPEVDTMGEEHPLLPLAAHTRSDNKR